MEFGEPHTHKYINNQLCGSYRLVICCDDMRERWNGYSYVDNQDGFHINKGGILMDYFEGCSGDTFQYCHKCGKKVEIYLV
jgi:hypothetical protein